MRTKKSAGRTQKSESGRKIPHCGVRRTSAGRPRAYRIPRGPTDVRRSPCGLRGVRADYFGVEKSATVRGVRKKIAESVRSPTDSVQKSESPYKSPKVRCGVRCGVRRTPRSSSESVGVASRTFTPTESEAESETPRRSPTESDGVRHGVRRSLGVRVGVRAFLTVAESRRTPTDSDGVREILWHMPLCVGSSM